MKTLLLLMALTLSVTSCATNEDKEDQFCGTVIGRGHTGNTDFIVILSGNERKQFEVSNYNYYPMHSYQCK